MAADPPEPRDDVAAAPDVEVKDEADMKTPEPTTPKQQRTRSTTNASAKTPGTDTTGEDDSDEDEEDEEPRLKYSRLTGSLAGCYRSDSTSSFLVAGDKMIVGSHNGNINVLTIPSFTPLKSYRAHTATITGVSISPLPPPWPTAQSVVTTRLKAEEAPTSSPAKPSSIRSGTTNSPRTPRQPQPQALIPATPSNSIHIATSSIDGLVCVQSLVDPRDVTLRNFARPVNAVALSPEYKSDRTYMSGGLAGSLILTTGGRTGLKENANTNSAAAAASGWLGSIGLSGNTGKDTILHSGEGTISSIKWSLSGKFVAWVNEQGIKIMRSNLKLESQDADYAWKRIAHIDRPNRRNWDEMAGVWKGRMEWIDERQLESDEDDAPAPLHTNGTSTTLTTSTAASESLKHTKGLTKRKKVEKLVVGWGDSAWVLHVFPEGPGPSKGKDASERVSGSATIVHHLLFDDCIVSGLSLYTPSLLLILAYRTHDDDDVPLAPSPRRGVHHRQNGMSPELRLVNVETKEEADVDTLTMKNYASLSAADYHLGTLYVPAAPVGGPMQRGMFSVFSEGLWDVGSGLGSGLTTLGGGATRLFSSGASVRSSGSGDNTLASPPGGNASGSINSAMLQQKQPPTPTSVRAPHQQPAVHSSAASPGLKIFIHSPYDCVLAVKRDLTDHLSWLLDHHQYREAYDLIDEHPEVVSAPNFESAPSISISDHSNGGTSVASTPSASKQHRESLVDFFANNNDETASQSTLTAGQTSAVEREKRRIGELWIQQLISPERSERKDWVTAGQVAGKVLGLSNRWQHWIFAFARAGRFDEISAYIPPTPCRPPVEGSAYEVVLGHYIQRDRGRLRQLLESWEGSGEMYSVRVVSAAIEERLERGDIMEGGEMEGDWRVLMDALAKLYLADARPRDALRCYIRLQNADAAMGLIREEHLLPAISDDLKGFVLLRISKEQLHSAPLAELEELSAEAVHLLVDEAYQGTVAPGMVVNQLGGGGSDDDPEPNLLKPFLFFYLRALWRGQGTEAVEAAKFLHSELEDIPSRKKRERQQRQQRLEAEGRALVEDYGDLAVRLFAEYDRALLMEFLRASRSYAFEGATKITEEREFWPELVYLLSQTGQTKKALGLIINRLGDVSLAIAFAKEQDDRELWDDLLDYSMDKPRFIRGLLEEVGTAIDPIKLVRRIPEGLEIEGLKEGVGRMVREFEIQASISDGVAKVLRSEVALGMEALRKGRARAVRFEVVHVREEEKAGVEVSVNSVKPPEEKQIASTTLDEDDIVPATNHTHDHSDHDDAAAVSPGHCAGCRALFVEDEKDTLIGFACGHVYHLTCLLDRVKGKNPDLADAAERLQNSMRRDAIDDEGFSRSVGSKVAHAHIVKGVVREGCVRCANLKDQDEEE